MATMTLNRYKTWLAAGFTPLLLAGCGSDSDDNRPPDANPPEAAEVSAEISTKQLRLSWPEVNGATQYKIYQNTDGSSGYESIGETDELVFTLPLAVHLTDWDDASFMVEACNQAGCSPGDDVYIAGDALGAIGYLKSPTPQDKSAFGFSSALSADGQILVVGSPRFDNDDQQDAGAVYWFSATESGWLLEHRIDNPAADGGAEDLFGYALALSADGQYLAVTAPYEDSSAAGIDGDSADNSLPDSGAAYLFSRDDNGVTQVGYFKASNPDKRDYYGVRIAMTDDASRLAVGAPYEASNAAGINGDQSNNEIDLAGAVYVYTQGDNAWSQEAYIKPSRASRRDRPCFDPRPPGIECYESSPSRFGYGLDFDAAGNTLAVGAPGENSSDGEINGDQDDFKAKSSGAVYVLTRTGTEWSHSTYLKANNPGIDDEFGYSLSLAGDGNTLAVGSPYEDSNLTGTSPPLNPEELDEDTASGEQDSGAVYLFARTQDSWVAEGVIKAEVADEDDLFGWSIVINHDGNLLAVGAPREDSEQRGLDGEPGNSSAPAAGAVYVYKAQADDWQSINYLKSSNTDANDTFGRTLAMSQDGQTLAISATGEDSLDGSDPTDDTGDDTGAVYLY